MRCKFSRKRKSRASALHSERHSLVSDRYRPPRSIAVKGVPLMVRGSARFDCYMSARRRVYSDLRLFAVSTYLELESGFDWLILLSRARNRLLYLQAADVYNTGLETLTFAVITFYSWINEQWESSCRRWENLKFKWSRSTPLLASLLRFRSTWIVTFQFFSCTYTYFFLSRKNKCHYIRN